MDVNVVQKTRKWTFMRDQRPPNQEDDGLKHFMLITMLDVPDSIFERFLEQNEFVTEDEPKGESMLHWLAN
eukprot:231129-Prymnesium_polylepis.1